MENRIVKKLNWGVFQPLLFFINIDELLFLSLLIVTIYWSDFLNYSRSRMQIQFLRRTYVGRWSCFDITFSGPGNVFISPASKDAESPSKLVSRISWGGGPVRNCVLSPLKGYFSISGSWFEYLALSKSPKSIYLHTHNILIFC